MMFLDKIKKIVDFEKELEADPGDLALLKEAKRMGFSDQYLAQLWNMTEDDLFTLRKQRHIFPIYKMIDTCAGSLRAMCPISTPPMSRRRNP